MCADVLAQLSKADQTDEKTVHTLKSSNLPFYHAIWEAAKASKALVVLHKRFYYDHQPANVLTGFSGKNFASVDIVSEDGREWIKVSTVTEHRLLFEISKARWESADSSDSEDETDKGLAGSRKENAILDRLDLVQAVNGLVQASKEHRIRYRNPKIRVVLPKISSPPPAQLQPLINRLIQTGATVDLGTPVPPSQDLDVVFSELLPSPHPPITQTLNVDCTILLALVSDLSHTSNHPVLPSYNGAIRRQIELETSDHLLPTSLWPAMQVKTLVCTEEAAVRMREIVDTIGTPNERARTKLLLEDKEGEEHQLNQKQRLTAFAKYSDYDVPADLRFPISITTPISESAFDTAIQDGKIPQVARDVSNGLTNINRSVFIYGWVSGLTTVTSNRTVARWIESTVLGSSDDAVGPDVWLREPARSLLGKEKQRRK